MITRTVWPGASLPIDSRTTRTVTVPSAAPAPAGRARESATDPAFLRLRSAPAIASAQQGQGPMRNAQRTDHARARLTALLQKRASASLGVLHDAQTLAGLEGKTAPLRCALRRSVGRVLLSGRADLPQSLLELPLDLLAVACARVEPTDEPGRLGPQARAISAKSTSDTLPMARSNSSSLIDRSVSAFSRSSAARVRPPSTCGAGRPRPSTSAASACAARRCPRRRRRRCGAQEDDAGGRLAARHEDDERRADQPGQREELPGWHGVGTRVRRSPPGSCDSVEVAELIVQAGIESGVDRRLDAGRGCRRRTRPSARREHDVTRPAAPSMYGSIHARRLKPSRSARPRVPGSRTSRRVRQNLLLALALRASIAISSRICAA